MTHIRNSRGTLGKAVHQGRCSTKGLRLEPRRGLRKHSGCSPGLTEGLLGLGALALPQARWPRREPVAPSLAAKSSPCKRMLASLRWCLAQGARSLRQEAFHLHSGNQELRGTSFPFQGAQWDCATRPCARRAPFHLSAPSVLLSVWLGHRDNTCRCLLRVCAG